MRWASPQAQAWSRRLGLPVGLPPLPSLRGGQENSVWFTGEDGGWRVRGEESGPPQAQGCSWEQADCRQPGGRGPKWELLVQCEDEEL